MIFEINEDLKEKYYMVDHYLVCEVYYKDELVDYLSLGAI